MDLTRERIGSAHKVELREFYKDYSPPRRVLKTVRKILDRVPQKYLQGLDCVVLTNMSGQPRRSRLGKVPSSKGYVSRSRVLGLYHAAHRGKHAWIEIYVDKIVAHYKGYLWVPFMREVIFGGVLCHEIGHHIHATVAREHSDKEDVAEKWKKKLMEEIGRKRGRENPLVRLVVKVFLKPPLKLFLWFRDRKRKDTAPQH